MSKQNTKHGKDDAGQYPMKFAPVDKPKKNLILTIAVIHLHPS